MPRVWFLFFFSSRRRHTRLVGDWSSDVCSSYLKQKTAYEISWCLEFRRVLFRSHTSELQSPTNLVCRLLLGVQTCADRKSTRLNSSHQLISYAVFCLKKKDT